MNERKDFPNRSHINDSRFFSDIKPNQEHIDQSTFPSQNIKALVEISNSTFELNLTKKIKMSSKVLEILDINWNVSPVNYQVNLLADKLWTSGTLMANLTYTKLNNKRVYIQHIPIGWKKTSSLKYIYPPILPLSNEKKHIEFSNYHSNTPSTEHFEQTIYNNDIPILEISSTRISTFKDIINENEAAYLLLNIDCEFFYRLFQFQVLKSR